MWLRLRLCVCVYTVYEIEEYVLKINTIYIPININAISEYIVKFPFLPTSDGNPRLSI